MMKEILQQRKQELEREKELLEETQQSLKEALMATDNRMLELEAVLEELRNLLIISQDSQVADSSPEKHSSVVPS